jgi:hypothetical protein
LLWDSCYHGGKGCSYFEPISYEIVDESELTCATAVWFHHVIILCDVVFTKPVMMSLFLQFKYYYCFLCACYQN